MSAGRSAFALVALLFLAACGGTGGSGPGRAGGFWAARTAEDAPGAAYALVLQIGDGASPGLAHTVDGGRLQFSSRIDEVRFDDPNLRLAFEGNGIRYEGEMNAAGDVVTGRLLYPGGGTLAMTLTPLPEKEVPMLRARPAGEPLTLTPPASTGDGWETGAPGEGGLDASAVTALTEAFAAGEYGQVHSFLVVRGGRLVVEEYFYGYGRDDLHALQSATKSVAALLVGAALGDGAIPDVDAPVVSLLPADIAAKAGSGWEEIRLRHLLTMTAGLAWDPASLRAAEESGGFFGVVLSREVKDAPGTRFSYDSPNVNLLGGVIRRATGRFADDYARDRLFAPIGIDTFDWESGRREGHPRLDGSLRLRPRDMAKLGLLLLRGGRWNGETVIGEAYVRSMTTPASETGDERYGYLWWCAKDEGPKTEGAGYASGLGSQFIVVVPELDLVVVTTGGNQYNGMHMAPLAAIKDRLLPAVP